MPGDPGTAPPTPHGPCAGTGLIMLATQSTPGPCGREAGLSAQEIPGDGGRRAPQLLPQLQDHPQGPATPERMRDPARGPEKQGGCRGSIPSAGLGEGHRNGAELCGQGLRPACGGDLTTFWAEGRPLQAEEAASRRAAPVLPQDSQAPQSAHRTARLALHPGLGVAG